jgi:hypothetical protein
MSSGMPTDEILTDWTLVEADWALVGVKTGPTRLGFALLLKFFEREARFPRNPGDFAADEVEYVAEQVKIAPDSLKDFDFSGRTAKRFRVQIRASFGFREFAANDEARVATWLAERVCPSEVRDSALVEALLLRRRQERLEPPARISRIVGSARTLFEQRLCSSVLECLNAGGAKRLESLLDGDASGSLLSTLKADPGPAGLEALLSEVEKLAAAQALDLPGALFDGVSEKVVSAWRARASRMYPSDFWEAPRPVRLTLLAALCHQRTAEIADSLVDLLLLGAEDQYQCGQEG